MLLFYKEAQVLLSVSSLSLSLPVPQFPPLSREAPSALGSSHTSTGRHTKFPLCCAPVAASSGHRAWPTAIPGMRHSLRSQGNRRAPSLQGREVPSGSQQERNPLCEKESPPCEAVALFAKHFYNHFY
jgi:hypothetical protein